MLKKLLILQGLLVVGLAVFSGIMYAKVQAMSSEFSTRELCVESLSLIDSTGVNVGHIRSDSGTGSPEIWLQEKGQGTIRFGFTDLGYGPFAVFKASGRDGVFITTTLGAQYNNDVHGLKIDAGPHSCGDLALIKWAGPKARPVQNVYYSELPDDRDDVRRRYANNALKTDGAKTPGSE